MTFEQRLINLVKEYEVLYNPEHPSFSKKPCRTAAWTEIAEKLNSDKLYCKNKWRGLRDTYKKLLLKITAAGGVYKYHRRKWQYLSLIAFINKYEPLYPKENGVEWPIFVDTCRETNTNILPMRECEDTSDYGGGVVESGAECIDAVNQVNENGVTKTQDSSVHRIQHTLSESYGASDGRENVKLIELTHCYAKSVQPNDKSDDFEAEFREEYLDAPMLSNAECQEQEVIEEFLDEYLDEANDVADTDTPRSCSRFLAELGAKIDSLCVPSNVQAELEKRIEYLVNQVLDDYNTAEQFIEDSS